MLRPDMLGCQGCQIHAQTQASKSLMPEAVQLLSLTGIFRRCQGRQGKLGHKHGLAAWLGKHDAFEPGAFPPALQAHFTLSPPYVWDRQPPGVVRNYHLSGRHSLIGQCTR